MLTKSIVRDGTTPPFSEDKCTPFLTNWTTHLRNMTGITLDTSLHAPRMWKLNIPTHLRELLWKDITRSLPIRATWFSNMERGHTCSCGTEMTLTHVWSSCRSHNLAPLLQELWDHLPALPDSAPVWTHPWYPLLALWELESARQVGKKVAKELQKS